MVRGPCIKSPIIRLRNRIAVGQSVVDSHAERSKSVHILGKILSILRDVVEVEGVVRENIGRLSLEQSR